MLVFVQSIERAKELFHELIYDGLNVDVIHSERTQAQRDNVVKCFRSGKVCEAVLFSEVRNVLLLWARGPEKTFHCSEVPVFLFSGILYLDLDPDLYGCDGEGD